MLSDIWNYLLALLWGWFVVMGGVLAIILALYERVVKKEELNLKRYAFVLAGFVLVAGFSAWRDERQGLSLEQKQHEKTRSELDHEKTKFEAERKKNIPDLLGEIMGSSLGRLQVRSERSSGIPLLTLFVRISNLGAQSIARDYRLSIDLPDKGRVIVHPSHFYGSTKFSLLRDNLATVDYSIEDAIYLKTAQQPIDLGDMKEGFIAFQFPGVSEDAVASAYDSVILLYSDVTGKNYEARPQPERNKEGIVTFLPSAPYTLSEPIKKKRLK